MFSTHPTSEKRAEYLKAATPARTEEYERSCGGAKAWAEFVRRRGAAAGAAVLSRGSESDTA